MIGLGTDLVQISSFLEQVQDTASHFVQETFSSGEIRYSKGQVSGKPHQHLAVRYAAKEAFIKAWSSCHRGMPPKIVHPNYKEIEIFIKVFYSAEPCRRCLFVMIIYFSASFAWITIVSSRPSFL